MKKIILSLMLIPVSAQAIWVSGGINVKSTTKYERCAGKAKEVVEAVSAFSKAVEAGDEALIAELWAIVEKREKKLKKCEKDAKKWYNQALDAVSGASIGVGGEF